MRRKRIETLLLMAVLASVVVGCSEPIKQDVVGTYTWSFSNVTDKIMLLPDGTLRQEVSYAGGTVWKLTSTWNLKHRAIFLDKSYQAYDEEHSAVRPTPELVYMCAFGWEGKGMSRWDGQLLWVKSSSP